MSIHPIESISVGTYVIPTDQPESDGTLAWTHTGVVCVHVEAGGQRGLGWSYTAPAAGAIVRGVVAPKLVGRSAMAIEGNWQTMLDAVRNDNRGGLCAMAISAVDVALWDLKARLLGISLVDLIGGVRDAVDIYGSGGFTSYDDQQLADQLSGWAAAGIARVKMKVGRDAQRDPHRVQVARQAIGPNVELFVDANGGYARKQALSLAEIFSAEAAVSWFEEPVSSDDLVGLHSLSDRCPAGMDVAAGEYGDTPDYFHHMLAAGAVDCVQADATRCGGITGFLKAAVLAETFHVPLSAHCAPQLHAHVGCCVRPLRHIEYFHDHVRLAPMIFDGVLPQSNGKIFPDRARPGHGLRLKEADAVKFAVSI